MSAVAIGTRASARPARISPAVIRFGALVPLVLFAGLEWSRLEAPARPGRLAACAAVAIAAALAAHHAGGLPRRLRPVALTGLVVLAAGLDLALAGVPLRLLAPAHWGSLGSGLGQGLQALPGIGVPYAGVDPWVHIVLATGGGLLLLAGALLGVWSLRRGTRPIAAATALAAAYAVAVVEHHAAHAYLWGAVLTVLLGALLWGDRLERAHAAAAALFVAVALAGALIAAPGVDAGKPWLDYQGLIDSLSTPSAISYDWNHGYGPLHWPRDNRELLRIAAKSPVYWKAADLDDFDGVGWRVDRTLRPTLDSEIAIGHRGWHQRLRVTVRDLRSATYVGAGTELDVQKSPRFAVPGAPGTFATGREPLRHGDSYLIDVYAPRPTELEMASSGSDYPAFASGGYLSMGLPPSVGGPRPVPLAGTPSTLGPIRIHFEQFGLVAAPSALDPDTGRVRSDGAQLLRRSRYAPLYELALRLREQSDTPYQYIRAVEAHLATHFAYTETPPRPRPGRPPLVSFMFDTHAGYCQQFSGAMALLLRMGGVPARVASGFTPGTYDAARREWVVRDVDAHSWVEAYMPRIGWVDFDPTPAVAPPHDQLANLPVGPDVRPRPLRPDPKRADIARRPAAAAPAGSNPATIPTWLVVVALLIAASAVGTAVAWLRRRELHADPPELAELLRALRRTGRPPAPATTLQSLEARFTRSAPLAAEYVAAVRRARFAGRAVSPSAAQRAALRTELAAGLGWGGRIRAWWALPPVRRRPGPVYNPR